MASQTTSDNEEMLKLAAQYLEMGRKSTEKYEQMARERAERELEEAKARYVPGEDDWLVEAMEKERQQDELNLRNELADVEAEKSPFFFVGSTARSRRGREQCSSCGKWVWKRAMKDHMYYHARKNREDASLDLTECPYCSVICSNKSNAKRHLKKCKRNREYGRQYNIFRSVNTLRASKIATVAHHRSIEETRKQNKALWGTASGGKRPSTTIALPEPEKKRSRIGEVCPVDESRVWFDPAIDPEVQKALAHESPDQFDWSLSDGIFSDIRAKSASDPRYRKFLDIVDKAYFWCSFCRNDVPASNADELQRHISEEHYIIKYKCNHEGCSVIADSAFDMQEHLHDVHYEPIERTLRPRGKVTYFKCPNCTDEAVFIHGMVAFNKHQREKHKDAKMPVWSACHCGLFAGTQEDVVAHIKEEHGMVHECTACDPPRRFLTNKRLRNHAMKKKHRKIVCDNCDERFTTMKALKLHRTEKHRKIRPKKKRSTSLSEAQSSTASTGRADRTNPEPQ